MLINFLVYMVIFCIIRIMIKVEASYLKIVTAYGILFSLLNLIVLQPFSLLAFIVSFIIYFIIGFAIVWLLERIIDLNIIWFTIVASIAQTLVGMLMSAIILAILK